MEINKEGIDYKNSFCPLKNYFYIFTAKHLYQHKLMITGNLCSRINKIRVT